ncbi:MAG: N-acetylmuramoyl-L-alanine amidase [Paraclostridium sp.]
MIETINNKKFLTISTSELMTEFKKYLGQPYVYGGDGTLKECMSSKCTHHKKGKKYIGYDCSGYMYKVLSKWDYNKFGRSTSQMMDNTTYGEWIYDKNELKVGDLMFFPGHVGVVSSNKNHVIKMYHAPKCGKNLCEIDSNYRKDFIKGLRVLKCNLGDNLKKDGESMRINVHAGHNPDGKTACGAIGIIKESTGNRDVIRELKIILEKEGHKVVDCTCDNGTSIGDVITKIANKSNANPCDLDVSIHFNSGANDKNGNGKSCGTEVLIYNTSGNKEVIGKRVCERISKLGYKNRGVKIRTDLSLLKKTKAPCILVECCFVDDKDDIDLYNAKTMAKAIAEGILNKTISTSTPSPTPSTGEIWYRAVCGSFGDKNNALDRKAKLDREGFSGVFLDAFVKDEKTMYRVVAGSFKDKSLAEKRVSELALKGYNDGFIAAFRK